MPGPYLSAPLPSPDLPRGIPYIVGNEAAERFSFYGMKGILVVFMTKHLISDDGSPAVMTDAEATAYFHQFSSSAYFFPVVGAILSDWLLGKYRTILSLSLVYCLGHLALALDETRLGLAVGLTLIAVGSGGIKPCVSAHVGDQFGTLNQHLLSKVFAWFYFAINLGAFASTLLTPWLLDEFGPRVAFGVPGALMLAATWIFWLGRHKFVHVPPGGLGFLKQAASGDGLKAIANLARVYVFVAVFWALYDQTGSTWVLQAERMDRHWLGFEWKAAQIQAANPILILMFIPLFSYVIYPAIDRVFPLTPLRKMSIGFFLAAGSFAICASIASWISAGAKPDIGWQILAYVVITAAEVMVSITCLEFSYTQAPARLKSLVMSFYLLSVSAGNAFTSAVNYLIQNPDGTSKLDNTQYFWFFAGVMLVTALGFVAAARTYRGRTYLQK